MHTLVSNQSIESLVIYAIPPLVERCQNKVTHHTMQKSSGVKQAQVFVGRDTLVVDAYPMKSGKQFVNTLEDNIRRRGTMDKLLSDSTKTKIYPIRSWTFSGHIIFQIGILSPTTRTKTLLNGGM